MASDAARSSALKASPDSEWLNRTAARPTIAYTYGDASYHAGSTAARPRLMRRCMTGLLVQRCGNGLGKVGQIEPEHVAGIGNVHRGRPRQRRLDRPWR